MCPGTSPAHVLPRAKPEVAMRLVWVILFGWLVIGALAAGQRNYYTAKYVDCSGVGTITATILFGPVNYLGGNPKFSCQ
jgi:hypothetical protein